MSARYEDRSKTFEKIFVILVGFGVFFLFTAFRQYFSIQFEKTNLLLDIEKAKSDIRERNIDVQNTSKQKLNVQQNITKVNSDIQDLRISINDELIPDIEITQDNINKINSDIDVISNIANGLLLLQQNISKTPDIVDAHSRDINRAYRYEEPMCIPPSLSILSDNATEYPTVCPEPTVSTVYMRLNESEYERLERIVPDIFTTRDMTLCPVLVPTYIQLDYFTNWLACNISGKVFSLFSTYDQIIQEHIAAPIQTFSNQSKLPFNVSTLEEQLGNLSSIYYDKYSRNQTLSILYEPAAVSVGLNDEVVKVWQGYAESIANQKRILEDDLSVRESDLGTLQSNLDELKNNVSLKESNISELQKSLTELDNRAVSLSTNLNELLARNQTHASRLSSLQGIERDLTERWKEIQSPFGSVPIELRVLVALFPLSLAFGFLVCCVLISDAIRLRRIIYYSYQIKNSNALAVADLKIAYIAPLWIDPSNPEKNNLLRIVILSVPFLIFIASLIMTLYNGSFTAEDQLIPVMGELERLVYGGLYATSMGFFVYGYLLIKNELD